jgi:hypothetical protein
MKALNTVLLVLCLSVAVWSQATPQAPAPEPPAPPAPPMHHGMPHGMPDDMAAMHKKHMDEAKAQIDKMKATVEQMQANLAKFKDPAARQQAQLDIDLWNAMIGHLDHMVKMMDAGPGMMGPGRMHRDMGMEHHEMGEHHEGMAGACCGGGMKEGKGCCSGGQCGKQGGPMMEDKMPPAKN